VGVVSGTSDGAVDDGGQGAGRAGEAGEAKRARELSRARELTRARERTYATSETGRHHHLGAAPTEQPVHVADSVDATATAAVQLAARTTHHLETQRSYLTRRMEQAAATLDFEDAATCRDALAAIDAELARRGETA
jgi:excinuclease UvrABC nuclease subunit